MKRLNLWVLSSVVLGLAAAPLAAANSKPSTRVVTRKAAAADAAAPRVEAKATAAAYSAQVNIVTRVQGTSFFRTAIDITNNTNTDGVAASVQYCYNLSGTFGCTAQDGLVINLHPLDNFHTDDMVQYLGTIPGLLQPGAEAASFGTLLVTFQNLPSTFGWEGTVTARTYSPYDQSNPSLGTVAIAYPGSLFFESANTTLVATIRDTRSAPTDAGALRTNLGVTNTDLNGAGPVNVALSFYDPSTGQAVGNVLTRRRSAAGRSPPDQQRLGRRGHPGHRSVRDRLRRHHEPDDGLPDDRGLRQHPGRRHAGRRVLRDEVRRH